MTTVFKYIVFFFTALSVFNSISARDLQAIKKSGEIYIGFDQSEIGNINYKLAYQFADYLDIELKEVIVDWNSLFTKNGIKPDNLESDSSIKYTPDAFDKIDLYAGSISPLEWRKKLFDFAPTMVSAEVMLVRKSLKNKPASVSDIAGMRIALMDGTSFVFHMNEHIKKIKGDVHLIKTETGADSKQLLIEGKADAIILDASDALTFILENNGEFEILFPISKISKLVWAVEHNNDLKNEVEHFFSFISNNGTLDYLFEEEYGVKYSSFEEEIKPRSTIQKYHRDLDEIIKDRKIVIALRERDFVYHKSGSKQFMHILAEEFAAYLGVDFEYVVVPDFSKYWEDKNGEINQDSSYTPEIYNYFDLACDIFAPLEWRKKKVDLIPVYETDYAVLAKNDIQINSTDDLKNYSAAVAKNTIYEQLVKSNNVSNIKYTSINNMVGDVIDNKADFTIIYNAFLYPELEQKLKMGSTNVNWAVRYDQPLLREALQNFIIDSERNGLLNALRKISEGTVLTNIEDFLKNYYQSSQLGTLPHILVGAEAGLPQEDINTIFQDNDGYLWFGTLSGAVKYNGKQMINYNINQGLISNHLNYISQNKNDDIYLATNNGFSIIRNSKIISVKMDVNINSIYFDNENKAWLVSDDKVYIYSDNKTEKYKVIANNSIGEIRDLCFDTLHNTLIVGAETGLYEINLSTQKLKRISNTEVYSAIIDNDNNLWFSNKNGVFVKCLKDNCESKNIINVNENANIPNSKILDISQSKSGSVWLINSRNVYEISSLDQKAIYYKTGEDLINNIILSFAEDREGNIWIGFRGGLQKIINNKSLRNFFPDIINHSISSVSIDEYDNIWINTNKSIFKYVFENKELINLNQLFESDYQFAISIKNPNANTIFVANNNGLFEVDANQNKIINANRFILESADKIFITADNEILIESEISGSLVYLKSINEKAIFINNENTKGISDLISHNDKILISAKNKILEFKEGELSLISEFPHNISTMASVENNVIIGTIKGIHSLNNPNVFHSLGQNIIIKDIIPSRSRNHLWIGTNSGIFYFNKETKKVEMKLSKKDGLKGNEIVEDGLMLDRKGLLWISTYHGLSNFDLRSNISAKFSPKCYLDSLIINGKSFDYSNNPKFKYNQNNLTFNLSALFFSDETSIEYEYYLRGIKADYDFVRREKGNSIYFNNLDPGKYTLVYRARGNDGIWSESNSLSFEIAKPIWEQWWFRILAAIAIGAILFSIYKIRVKQIVIQKQKLEGLVNIRTQELQKANTQIQSKNKQITDSIHYAERIQKSVLPKPKIFEQNFADYFILFKPRDIVSGDFFWTYQLESKVIVCAADCTGHGVPGAFMSMLGISFLKEIVSKSNLSNPGEILNELRKEVVRALQQEGKIDEAKDGMDLSLISYDTNTKILEYAGANNGIYIFAENQNPILQSNKRVKKRDSNFFEVQPNKMPIAIYERMHDFSTFSIKLEKGNRVYLYSDGYADQFGGPNNKKFKYPKFRKIITSTLNKDMTHQFAKLEVAFDEWKRNQNQVDDVTVIGFEVG